MAIYLHLLRSWSAVSAIWNFGNRHPPWLIVSVFKGSFWPFYHVVMFRFCQSSSMKKSISNRRNVASSASSSLLHNLALRGDNIVMLNPDSHTWQMAGRYNGEQARINIFYSELTSYVREIMSKSKWTAYYLRQKVRLDALRILGIASGKSEFAKSFWNLHIRTWADRLNWIDVLIPVLFKCRYYRNRNCYSSVHKRVCGIDLDLSSVYRIFVWLTFDFRTLH